MGRNAVFSREEDLFGHELHNQSIALFSERE